MKAKGIDQVLVTGGLGFIGSHVVDILIDRGYDVKILDNLEPQVHGTKGELPSYVNDKATLIRGDVREKNDLSKVLKEIDAVIHLAAAVGVGQSMYQINKYVSYNTGGTANILDLIVNSDNSIKKLVVASSMSIYGEGKYSCKNCGEVYPQLRTEDQVSSGDWEPKCPVCEKEITSIHTDEKKPLMPTSLYAQTKRHQEEMCLLIGKSYSLPTVALRFFNVYGPRQSLSNPYTGVCAVFSSRILNGKPPYVFEDGKQQRDFVNVKDLANANVLALEKSNANYQAINVGSGQPISILRLAEILINLYDANLEPKISKRYRKGDIRHCYADITKAKALLGYEPTVSITDGLNKLVEYGKANNWASVDLFEKSLRELEERKLI